MIRTQVQLTEAQARRLKETSERTGLSMAELIRRAVDRSLESGEPDRDELWRRALATVGAFNSGLGDLTENHDKYLEEQGW